MFIMVKRSHNLVQGAANLPSHPVRPLDAVTELGLVGMIKRAQSLDALDQTLRQYLPATLAENSRLANVDADKLVYSVSNPVWKSKLRLYGDALIRAANEAGVQARTLTIKVIPQAPIPQSPYSGKPLTQAVRDGLRTTAHSVEDPQLREQLLKLASLP
jgi:hypothetical protein